MRYHQTMKTLIRALRRLGHGIVVTVAILWFVIDVFFLSIVHPLRDRIMQLAWMQTLRTWIETLGPYGSLAMFAVPLLILEPVKPIGALLFHHGHHIQATIVIILGELTKLAIFDQIFEMTKSKLMTFRWFAWVYREWRAVIDAIRALPIRQIVSRWFHRLAVRWR